MEILKCENVRKVYGSGNNQVVALDHIDLSVQKGEFVAIVGASGSGKSTLLHILGSVDKPTKGKVLRSLQPEVCRCHEHRIPAHKEPGVFLRLRRVRPHACW